MIIETEIRLDLGELGQRECLVGASVTNDLAYWRPQAEFRYLRVWSDGLSNYMDLTEFVTSMALRQHLELMVEDKLPQRALDREWEPENDGPGAA